MTVHVHKLTYADGRAYQYRILDEDGQLRYVAERTGMLLPTPSALTEFFDAGHNLSARLQPPEVLPWQRPAYFELVVGTVPAAVYAVIEERWRLVDAVLLRLPTYEMRLYGQRFIARGSRYGAHLYEIFRACEEAEMVPRGDQPVRPVPSGPCVEVGLPTESAVQVAEEPRLSGEAGYGEVKVGQIDAPLAGPGYQVEAVAAPLRGAILALGALVILIDMELYPLS